MALDQAAWTMVLAGVMARGKAQPGDKTMIDALAPAVQALDGAQALGAALQASAAAAQLGATATMPMVAHKGRASYLGDRAIGHQDAGVTSLAMLLGALAEAAG